MLMTIGQFSKITGFSIDTIRYYEKEKIINIDRDSIGRRVFSDSDVAWMIFIKKLKETGMPLKNIQHYSELRYQGDSTMVERLKLLENHKTDMIDNMNEMNNHLLNLDEKIDYYKKKIDHSEVEN